MVVPFLAAHSGGWPLTIPAPTSPPPSGVTGHGHGTQAPLRVGRGGPLGTVMAATGGRSCGRRAGTPPRPTSTSGRYRGAPSR